MKKEKGFTLIETLVAITVLVVAVAAPLTLAAQSLFAAYYAKDQLVASHLAQEAIEIVRQKRDHNLMAMLNNSALPDSYWLHETKLEGVTIGTQKTVTVDVADIENTPFTLITSGGIENNGAILQHNNAIYLHDIGSNDTRFRRVVELKKISEEEIEVVAKVMWQTGSFRARAFTIKENLYNWLSN